MKRTLWLLFFLSFHASVTTEVVAQHVVTIMDDNFESGKKSGWKYTGNPTWGIAEYQDNNVLWCMGSTGRTPGFGTYDSNMSAWAIFGPFDLSDAEDAVLSFDYNYQKEEVWRDDNRWGEKLGYYASLDGANFNGYVFLGENSFGWKTATRSFKDWSESVGDLTGESQVWIGFKFESDVSDENGFGAFLDNIKITKTLGGPAPLSYTLNFPHLGNGSLGNIWLASEITLLNTSNSRATFELEVRDDNGDPLSLPFIENIVSEISPGGSAVLKTDGKGALIVGCATVRSDVALSGFVLFRGSVGEAGVFSSEMGTSFVAPVEGSPDVRVGLAFIGSDGFNNLSLTLKDRVGQVVATGSAGLKANAHRSFFLDEVNWSTYVDFSTFSGSVVIEGNRNFATILLRQGRSELSTLPVVQMDGQGS